MVRYVISEPVQYQEATPRGILEGSFKAGPVEVEPGSDDHFIIEYVLIPEGFAVPSTKSKSRPKPTEPESAPSAPETEAPKE